MDLVDNLNGSSPPFCNSSFALLRRFQVPYYVIKLWVFKYLRSLKRCPSFDVRVSQLERFAMSFHSHQSFIDEDLFHEIAKRGDIANSTEAREYRRSIHGSADIAKRIDCSLIDLMMRHIYGN